MLAYVARRALAAALLLAAACTTETTAAAEDGGATDPGARPPASVLGKWVYGAMSLTDYYDAQNGSYIGNGYGTSVLFTFDANGHYTQTVYISSTVYSCRMDVFVYDEGTVKFDATAFRVYPTKGTVRSKDTCNAANNYTRADDLARKQGDVYSWGFEQNPSDGKTYLMIGPNGTTENRSSFRPAQ